MPVAKKVKSGLAGVVSGKVNQRFSPVWDGPCADTPNGGCSQSMLNQYLACQERFRIRYIDGWALADSFQKSPEFGNMWHCCEQHFADGKDWQAPLKAYCQSLCKQYPLQQDQVEHWYSVCKCQFPSYIDYWAKHKDVTTRTPLMQEQVFNVPYHLPSGRTVRLRGKWDSVDLIGTGKNAAVWLFETKTKGDINEGQLQRQLLFDLQTLMYLICLENSIGDYLKEEIRDDPKWPPFKIKGVRYNCVRRPLSGGKDSIRQHKPSKSNPQGESSAEFYARLGGLIKEEADLATAEKRDCHYFMRWQCEVNSQDIQRFKREFLDPTLENLADDYEWWNDCNATCGDVWNYKQRAVRFVNHRRRHVRLPYGVWNPTAENQVSDVDSYLETGSTVGLVRCENLFQELQ